MAVELEITADQAGQRLDRLVKSIAPHVGFGAQQKWFRTGQVRLNGKRVNGAERVEVGDQLRLPPQAQNANPSREAETRPIRDWSSNCVTAPFLTMDRFWPLTSLRAWLCRVGAKQRATSMERCPRSPTKQERCRDWCIDWTGTRPGFCWLDEVGRQLHFLPRPSPLVMHAKRTLQWSQAGQKAKMRA